MKQKFAAKKLTAFCAALVMTVTSAAASFSAYAKDIELPIVPANGQTVPSKYDLRNVDGKNYVTTIKYQNPFGTCWSFAAAAAAETTYLFENDMGVPAGQENDQLDFSEKHTAWYTYMPVTEDDVYGNTVPASQVGEGRLADGLFSGDFYQVGGTVFAGFDTYARFGGPVLENTEIDGTKPFEYCGLNKWITNDPGDDPEHKKMLDAYVKTKFILGYMEEGHTEEEAEAEYETRAADPFGNMTMIAEALGMEKTYAPYDNWSLPLNAQYRIANGYTAVKSFKTFTSPRASDDNDEYEFSQENLDAIKKEISSGHAMTVFLSASILGESENTMPDDGNFDFNYEELINDPDLLEQIQNIGGGEEQEEEPDFLNKENWAQYTNIHADANHIVTVIGYDDSYPKENFQRQNKQGEDDPTTVPPENGAFIIKNSWGSITAEDEETATVDPETGEKTYDRIGAKEFGIDNSGIYYVSYYDMSLDGFASVELYKQGEKNSTQAAQYDLMSPDDWFPMNEDDDDEKILSANVFTSQQDEYLRDISVYAAAFDTQLKYSVYKNPKDGDPASGELLETGSKQYESRGYYRFSLNKPYALKKGDKYSIVIEQKGCNVAGGEPAEYYSLPSSFRSSKGIIGSGESFVFSDDKWTDLSDKADSLKDKLYEKCLEEAPKEEIDERLPNGASDIQIDNLPIRGYTEPAPVRFAGDTRFDTAAKISSESGLFNESDTVIIANGMEYADALAGVPLAAQLKAPILLTKTDELPDETAAEIKRLKATKAIILGGTGAVSEKVVDALKELDVASERISGATRFSTATAIAEKLTDKPKEVFFVYGLGFADALSASTAAAVKGAPIIYLSTSGEINADTKAYLEKHKDTIENAYIIGGTGVISVDMMKQAANALGQKKLERIYGDNRFDTCIAVNDRFAQDLSGDSLCIATGSDFPDALAGGVFAALNKSPLLLINGKAAKPEFTKAQTEFLRAKSAESFAIFGGTGAVSEEYALAVLEASK